MSLFDRVAAVDIQPQGGSGIRAKYLNGIGSRIIFDVTRTHTETSNTATISIYNLSHEHRAQLQGKNAKVRLYAGYKEDTGAEQLFMGTSSFINSRREPPDVITEIQAQDGIKELREFRVSLSYKPGVSVQQVLTGIAGKLGIPLRAAVSAQGTYEKGYVFLGPVKEALDQVCRRANLQWSIQDVALLILPRGKSWNSIGVLISPETGMIGSAERINYIKGDLDGDPVKKPEWKVVTLLQPKIIPTHRVQVQSKDLTGTLMVETVHHYGDTSGGPWYTELELKDE